MIISFPTSQGTYTFCVNAAMMKLLASLLSLVIVLTGYTIVQLSMFILSATPQQFLRIILFTAFLIGIILVSRSLLSKRGAV